MGKTKTAQYCAQEGTTATSNEIQQAVSDATTKTKTKTPNQIAKENTAKTITIATKIIIGATAEAVSAGENTRGFKATTNKLVKTIAPIANPDVKKEMRNLSEVAQLNAINDQIADLYKSDTAEIATLQEQIAEKKDGIDTKLRAEHPDIADKRTATKTKAKTAKFNLLRKQIPTANSERLVGQALTLFEHTNPQKYAEIFKPKTAEATQTAEVIATA